MNSGRLRQRTLKLLTWTRQRSPGVLRKCYRLLRSVGEQALSPRLPRELVANSHLCADRFHLIENMPKDGVVAELGTYRGDFARQIIEHASPRHLHLIDIDFSNFDPRGLAGPNVSCHSGLISDVLSKFPDEYFDWIYVDANHSYSQVAADCRLAADKVRRGGYLVFNDFAHIDPMLGRYGVHRAVSEFIVDRRWKLAFFALDPVALYDVAIQRPID